MKRSVLESFCAGLISALLMTLFVVLNRWLTQNVPQETINFACGSLTVGAASGLFYFLWGRSGNA